MTTQNFVLSAIAILSLSACQSVPVDSTGAIPAAAAAQMDSVDGTYNGQLSLSDGSIDPTAIQVTLSRDSNRPEVSLSKDIAGEGCNSRIGKLIALETREGVWDLVGTFEFNPGLCAGVVEGTVVTVYWSQKRNHGLLSLLKDTEQTAEYETESRSYLIDFSK